MLEEERTFERAAQLLSSLPRRTPHRSLASFWLHWVSAAEGEATPEQRPHGPKQVASPWLGQAARRARCPFPLPALLSPSCWSVPCVPGRRVRLTVPSPATPDTACPPSGAFCGFPREQGHTLERSPIFSSSRRLPMWLLGLRLPHLRGGPSFDGSALPSKSLLPGWSDPAIVGGRLARHKT